MPDDNKVSSWLDRIRVANDYHKRWWNQFECGTSNKYYEGTQWKGASNYFRSGYRPYVVNLVFSTIEVQTPSLLFTQPIFHVKPKSTQMDTNPEAISRKNSLREAALNTFATDPDNLFADEIELAILDSFFAFGLVEVGMDSNYLTNPNADKPYLRKDGEILQDIEGKDIIQPKEIPEWEQVYIKRIHPGQFRVGGMDTRYINRCNWVGYYEYVDVLDVKGNKALKNVDKLTFSGARTSEFDATYVGSSKELDNLIKTGDVIKIWKIWDIRRHQFNIFTDAYQEDYLFSDSFNTLPLYPLTFHPRTRGFYPIPPVSQWLSPQDDLNEANEQLRVHRKRGSRKYITRKNIIDTDDMDKLMFGPDGTYVEVEGDPQTAIAAVPLAPLENSVTQTFVISKDNFNVVTGTASEQRGQADRTTATQASIIDARSKIRSSKPQAKVACWLKGIARQVLALQKDLTLPFWIKVNNTPEEQLMGDVQDTQEIYQQITGMDIDGEDFEVDIDVASMSPVENEEQKTKFLEFMAVINNYPQIALSPTLIRETADRIGYRTNEKVIKDLQNMAMLAQASQMAQLKGATMDSQSALAQRQVAKSTPNQQEQITQQLDSQVGLTQ